MAIVAPVAPTPVTPLPTPPTTSDPVNFDSRADNFLGGLPTNQTEMNALGTNVYNNSVKTFDSATISKSSADLAVPAATDAVAAKVASEAAYTNMQKLYLGAKTTAPTVDNQGNPLQVGAWYTNTTLGYWYWWSGTVWKIGVADLSTVDYETQVTNKGKVVTTDTTQTITGLKTFSNTIDVMGLKHTYQHRATSWTGTSAAIATGNTLWTTVCKFRNSNVPLYSRFILMNSARHYAIEVTLSKTARGANGLATTANLRLLGSYSYFPYIPAKFRVVDMGTNAESRFDISFLGTGSSSETFDIFVIEDFGATDRATLEYITYPLTASGSAAGCAAPNMLTMVSGTQIVYAEGRIAAGCVYSPVVDLVGSVGQVNLETSTAA